ncbi:MAG: aminotransferase class IV [Lentisphaerae bacterium]|nr:aminotransferase class IV [Lentisphaerota bacterium]
MHLLETLRWTPAGGFYLLERHVSRLARSASALGWVCDPVRIRAELERAAVMLPGEPCRVRLCVTSTGGPSVTAVPLAASPLPCPMRVGLASAAIDAGDMRLFHKTTDRRLYDQARAACPGVDDVVLHNERGEVTESTIANVVIERRGERLTPPIACGLLPGVYREHLLERGEIREEIITIADLRAATTLFLINSVREWLPAVLVD